MSTKITINYHGKDYDLEYTRATAAQIEDLGFSLDKLTDKPAKTIPLLFHGAFLKHNRGIKPQFTDEIFKNLANKSGEDGEGGPGRHRRRRRAGGLPEDQARDREILHGAYHAGNGPAQGAHRNRRRHHDGTGRGSILIAVSPSLAISGTWLRQDVEIAFSLPQGEGSGVGEGNRRSAWPAKRSGDRFELRTPGAGGHRPGVRQN